MRSVPAVLLTGYSDSVFTFDPSKFLCTPLVVPSAAANKPASSVYPILPACCKLPIISFILCLMELRAWFFPSQNSFSVRRLLFSIFMGHCDGTVGKESAYNAGDTGEMGSISGSRRSPGEGNGNPLQYSCLRISSPPKN